MNVSRETLKYPLKQTFITKKTSFMHISPVLSTVVHIYCVILLKNKAILD